MNQHWKHKAPPHLLKQNAKILRQGMTDVELLMWHCLRRSQLGFKFRRQHPLDHYILDFYCPKMKLAIELDGSQHAVDEDRARDADRTAYLGSRGIKVLRFWNTDVLIDTEGVLESIWRELLTLSETRKPPT